MEYIDILCKQLYNNYSFQHILRMVYLSAKKQEREDILMKAKLKFKLKGSIRVWMLLGVLLVGIVGWAINYYMTPAPRFNEGTVINGIDCSDLTAAEAAERLSSAAQDVTFSVVKPNSRLGVYKPTEEEVKSFELPNKEMNSILRHFVKAQKEDSSIKVFYVDLFTLDEEGLRDYLAKVPELNGENMVIPKDAYLTFNDEELLEIVQEKYGNYVDFDKAVAYAVDQLSHLNTSINFTLITEAKPHVLASDEELVQTKERINNCLNTVVNFKLTNGDTITLDKSITRNWVIEEIGSFEIDESQIEAFVSELAEKVDKTKSTIYMPVTGIGWAKVPVGFAVLKVDQEAQVQAIKEYLETGETHNVSPKYTKLQVEDFFNSYIEVDIDRQMVWMYVNGECVLETKCVTGMANTSDATPTGIYVLQQQNSPGRLTDNKTYVSIVVYWMGFNGGYGFHDAWWKEINGVEYFGGTYYLTDGSHGCVNLPTWAAKIMYQNITWDMPIIIYNSSKIIQIESVSTNVAGSLNLPRLYVDIL